MESPQVAESRRRLNWLRVCALAGLGCWVHEGTAGVVTPAPQRFEQEVAVRFGEREGVPPSDLQILLMRETGDAWLLGGGRWYAFRQGRWSPDERLIQTSEGTFVFPADGGEAVTVGLRWREVIQVIGQGRTNWVVTPSEIYEVAAGHTRGLSVPSGCQIRQAAVGKDGVVYLAGDHGLLGAGVNGWESVAAVDAVGRAWGRQDALGVAIDGSGQLWFASRAGVGCRTAAGWRFYEGKDGLPWNEFTGIAVGRAGELWFSTSLGVIRLDRLGWQYRQGPGWLPDDAVRQVAVDAEGRAWVLTRGGLGAIERRPMTLAAKAEEYEGEIDRYIRRTPFGFVAEAALRRAGDRSSADPQDSDNDGLWTAMYGAGECFAYGATADPKAKERARRAFEALRFLQEVTQGGAHSPPRGYVARTIRSTDSPDPNQGRLERDRAEQKEDTLWKVYEPRWPRSADGKWYWKSDTSSDELDGHYFFYPLDYDFCAGTEEERERVRRVVRELTDHLLEHDFVLIDHDGRPTRWAVFGPKYLNRDANWWPERGLNSLSILSYLAVAAHVTGEAKYAQASRRLIEEHGYAQNAMYPKVQHGPGSGNQSDDEMAFMCFYSLLRHSQDEGLKRQIRYSFFRYWANEAPEMNPFFHFAYAGQNRGADVTNPWGSFPLDPWEGWLEDSMSTLRGFSLDRLNWSHRNSHRLDVELLGLQQSGDLYAARRGGRGVRVGKVLPVENRHFNHWNTDPWDLDYGGSGNELAAGTVYLLPYYMGLYHGFIEKP